MLKIAAVVYLSMSEIQTEYPWITDEFVDENQDTFKQMLYDAGMDVYQYPYEIQDCTHRNRFQNIVTCRRFVGNERIDKSWVESPYCSVEAQDKSLNSRLLTDCYRMRGLVESE